jgi:hypothetical protein
MKGRLRFQISVDLSANTGRKNDGALATKSYALFAAPPSRSGIAPHIAPGLIPESRMIVATAF